MIAWAIIWFIAVLSWDIISDYKKWLLNRTINHSSEWLVRAVLLIPSLVLFNLPIDDSSPLKMLSTMAMVGFWYWFLFDGLYNKIRGFDWWFTGSDDPDDAATDNFLQKLTLNQHIIVKTVPIIIFTILYSISGQH